jgi:1-acyl-sn-glycerol-3-phosphate acyltransferase
MRLILERLEAGGIVLLYPEGTRTPTGRLQRAKTGIARMALTADVPVVPVGLTGTFDLLPRNRSLPDMGKRKSVCIRIGQPLSFASLGARNEDASPGIYRRVADQVMLGIAALVGQPYPYAKQPEPAAPSTPAWAALRSGPPSLLS